MGVIAGTGRITIEDFTLLDYVLEELTRKLIQL